MANATFDGARGPLQEEFEVGDDGDMPGLAAPVTSDDVDAVVHSARYSTDEKREILSRMLSQIQARAAMDATGDATDLGHYLEDAMRRLESPGADEGSPSAYGFDPQTRSS